MPDADCLALEPVGPGRILGSSSCSHSMLALSKLTANICPMSDRFRTALALPTALFKPTTLRLSFLEHNPTPGYVALEQREKEGGSMQSPGYEGQLIYAQ